ncbi:hypothetical protein QYF61_012581, partial [Mycteria americana]
MNMARPGKLTILDHGHEPAKESTMCLQWWKQLAGIPLKGLWPMDMSTLDKVHLEASVAVDEVHAAADTGPTLRTARERWDAPDDLEYSGPQILCIPDSKTQGVDLESPLVLFARSSSRRISSRMGIRESRLVRYCLRCTVVVAIGTCCSLTLSNPTTEGSSERLGKVDSCFISSVSKAAIRKAHRHLALLSQHWSSQVTMCSPGRWLKSFRISRSSLRDRDRNRYEALGMVDKEHNEMEEEESVQVLSPRSDQPTPRIKSCIKTSAKKKQWQIMVIGDSLLRGKEASICKLDPLFMEVYCLPGARSRDVTRQLKSLVQPLDYYPLLLFRVGTNDVATRSP